MEPNFLSDGTSGRRTDTRWVVTAKILGAFQNQGGSYPSNNPRRTDTLRKLRYKINRAKAGVA